MANDGDFDTPSCANDGALKSPSCANDGVLKSPSLADDGVSKSPSFANDGFLLSVVLPLRRAFRSHPRHVHTPTPRTVLTQCTDECTDEVANLSPAIYNQEETRQCPGFPSPHSQPRALRHTTVLSNIMSL